MNARERVDRFMRNPKLIGMNPKQVQRVLGGSNVVELDSIRHAQQIARERLAVIADARCARETIDSLNPTH